MGKSLDELASYFMPAVQEFLTTCEALGVPCRVIDTGRTVEQQSVKVTEKVSWTSNSKHLPQLPEMKSEAVDIVPLQILSENKADWDPHNQLWLRVGLIGEGLGLVWGGRWTRHPDMGHFECSKDMKARVIAKSIVSRV